MSCIAKLNINHLDKNILCDQQHGFGKRRSYESQLITTIHDLTKVLNRWQVDNRLILKFFWTSARPSTRFHTRNFPSSSSTINVHYDIRWRTLAWIQSFLYSRHQQVIVEGEKSRPAPVTSGVPFCSWWPLIQSEFQSPTFCWWLPLLPHQLWGGLQHPDFSSGITTGLCVSIWTNVRFIWYASPTRARQLPAVI